MSSSPLSPSPSHDMQALRRPSYTVARVSSFSIRDFEQLLSDAFDLSSTPTLSLTPASPAPSQSSPSVSPCTPPAMTSYFDDTDDDHDRPNEVRPRRRPRSQSFSAFDSQRILPPSPFPTSREQTSRRGVAKRVFQTLRTRASALVLRPSDLPNPAVNGRDTPVPPSRTSVSTVTARPSLQFDESAQSSRRPFLPSSRRGSAMGELDVMVALAQPKASPLPPAPLTIPKQPMRDGRRSAEDHSSMTPRNQSPAPTFLGDLVSAQRSSTPVFFTRPRTPSLPPSTQRTPHIHTRLPPLKQSRSLNLTAGQRKHSRKKSLLDPIALTVTSSSMAIEFEQGELPSRCSSPYKNPRAPPPIPPKIETAPSHDLWLDDDSDELQPPSFVFERRGSATSVHSNVSMQQVLRCRP